MTFGPCSLNPLSPDGQILHHHHHHRPNVDENYWKMWDQLNYWDTGDHFVVCWNITQVGEPLCYLFAASGGAVDLIMLYLT